MTVCGSSLLNLLCFCPSSVYITLSVYNNNNSYIHSKTLYCNFYSIKMQLTVHDKKGHSKNRWFKTINHKAIRQ